MFVSKNRFRLGWLMAVILTTVLVVSLLGCSGGQSNVSSATVSPAPTIAAEKSGYVEELKIGICRPIAPRTLMSYSSSFGRMNYNAFCAGIFITKNAEGQIQPNIMTKWEISEDGKVLLATFATDKGITWHDDKPLTMDDIMFTFEHMASYYLSDVDHLERVSDTQIRIFFTEPRAFYMLNRLALFQYVFPKHIWEKVEKPTEYAKEDGAIGCGPYKLVKVDEDAQTVHFEAVGETYMGRPLSVRSVTVRSYNNQSALVMAIRNGEVDAMYDYSTPIEPTLAASVAGSDGVNIGMSKNLGNYMISFGFKKQPTDDLSFRKAVRYALDYKLLATVIGGKDGEIPGVGIIPSLGIGFDPSLPANTQDLDQAKALLDKGGYVDVNGDGYREMPDGGKMNVIITPQNRGATQQPMFLRIAEIIGTNLNTIGVKTTLDDQSVRNEDYNKTLLSDGTYQLYIAYCTHGLGMFVTAYMYVLDEGPGVPYGSCLDPKLSTTYQNLMKAQDYENYSSSVKTLQKLNAENVYGIALCWDKSYYPYRTDKYVGWTNFPGWGVINSDTWYNLHPVK